MTVELAMEKRVQADREARNGERKNGEAVVVSGY